MPAFNPRLRSLAPSGVAGGGGRVGQALLAPVILWRGAVPALLLLAGAFGPAQSAIDSPTTGGSPTSPTSGATSAGAQPDRRGNGPAPTAGLGGSASTSSPSPQSTQPQTSARSHRAFGADGLYFYPGFGGGCATAGGAGGIAVPGSTLLSPRRRPTGPARSRGHYVQLSVAGSEVYTDNLNREHDGQSDFITEVAPRLDACQSTGRVRGDLTYRLEGVAYANHPSNNDVYNDVSGNTTINIVPSHFYLDANTRYGQTVDNPNVGYSGSNAIAPGNKTTEWTFNVSPYALQSLGPVGRARLRYRYGQNRYEDGDVPDSHVNAVYFNLASPPRRDIVTWNLNVMSEKITRDRGDANDYYDKFDVSPPTGANNNDRTQYFDKAVAQIGLQATDTLQLIGRGGVEDRYDDDGDNHRFSSPLWSVGFNWNSGRNSVSGRYGHRFFGATYYLQAAHRAGNWRAALSYREDPSSRSRDALNGGNYNPRSRYFQSANSLFDRGVYVEKRWQATLTYNTALTRTRLRGYYRTRDYEQSDVSSERSKGASISTRYQFAPRTALVPRFDWHNTETGDTRNDYNTFESGISLVHILGPEFRVGLSYLHAWRTESGDNAGYTENRVALQFFKGF